MIRVTAFIIFVVVACCMALGTFVNAIPIVTQVHVITRHGSRTQLRKTHATNSTNGNSTSPVRVESSNPKESLLTPLGELQHYRLGTWLLQRYNNLLIEQDYLSDKENDTNYFYNPILDDIRLESSDTERTISSASALSLGLVPIDSRRPSPLSSSVPNGGVDLYRNIPIYMVAKRNDIYIRGYEQCPAATKFQSQLYETNTEWIEVEKNYTPFLQNLTNTLLSVDEDAFISYVNNVTGFIPLREIWNVFDIIMIQKTECTDNSSTSIDYYDFCNDEYNDVISANDWEIIQKLVQYSEYKRYSTEISKDLLGGPLFYKIYERMIAETIDDVKKKNGLFDSEPYDKSFYLYSAHYPTILSIFASLTIDPIDAMQQDDNSIPPYASALIFELYKDDDYDYTINQDGTNSNNNDLENFFVSLQFKQGGSNESVPVQLPGPCLGSSSISSSSNVLACPLIKFQELVRTSISYTSPQEWCTKCENQGPDVCRVVAATSNGTTTTGTTSNNSSNDRSTNPGFFVLVFVLAFLGGIGCCYAVMRWKNNNNNKIVLDDVENCAMGNTKQQQQQQDENLNQSIDDDDSTSKKEVQ